MTIDDLLENHDPKVRAAFFSAIQDISSRAQLSQVTRALENDDLDAAISALFLDEGAFSELIRTLEDAYHEGGKEALEELGTLRDQEGARFVARFNGRNRRAENYLQRYSSSLITRLLDDQREAVRSFLTTGLSEGRNPRTTALDLIGRLNRRTGKREGGIIGLSSAQEKYVKNARTELEDGNLKRYLNRSRRDKRFDKTILRAIAEERKLTKLETSRMIGRYSDGLLQLRGFTISRTETLASLHAGQDEALHQLVETGNVRSDQIRRTWESAGDFRVRNNHRIIDGTTVGLDERFNMPSGAIMKYPGDPAGGAAEVANCRCVVTVRIERRLPNR